MMENYPIVPGRGLVTAAATKMRLEYLASMQNAVPHIAETALPLPAIQHNIESFIGSVEIPVGLVGPLLFRDNNKEELVHGVVGTLEGALVASMNRGAKAISLSGGFEAAFIHQKMSRAPMFRFEKIADAVAFIQWTEKHFQQIKRETKKHSNHAILREITTVITGRNVHAKFIYSTGDASGQNMTTTCTWHAMQWIVGAFQKETGVKIISHVIEGNASSDKKVSSWSVVEGRGVHVVAECFLKEEVINKILRTTSDRIVECYNPSVAVTRMDGMMGYNINVANAIASLFVATGQDLASIHESSTAILSVEKTGDGLYLSLNLPSLVIGTVGGGTHLPKQNEALRLMNCAGTGKIERFAKLIAGFALSLEISTYAAIVSGEFAKAHEKLGRNKPVKWLLPSEITESLVREMISAQHHDAEVFSVKLNEENLTENGIITTLTARASKKLIGFIPMTVNVSGSNGLGRGERNVLIKSKALDIEVIRGFHLMAASIDPELSDLIYGHRDFLEYNNCHEKEIRMYNYIAQAGFDTIPYYYGACINRNKEAYLVMQEMLNENELRLFNSENRPDLWDEATIRNTIDAIAKLHKVLSDDKKFMEEFDVFRPEKALRLYEKLADINSREEEDPALKAASERMRRYLGELREPIEEMGLPLTVIHNDFNPRNIAIRKDNRVCIYDWELVVRNIPHRDIVELLAFVLRKDFTVEELNRYLDHHYFIAGQNIQRSKWNSGYERALKEFLVTRVSFYKAAGIVMKLKFADRIMANALRMIEMLEV